MFLPDQHSDVILGHISLKATVIAVRPRVGVCSLCQTPKGYREASEKKKYLDCAFYSLFGKLSQFQLLITGLE